MTRWLVCVFLLLGGMAKSDPLRANDYAKMFELYADQLVTDAGGARVLERTEGVTIYESVDGDERYYTGVDFDEGGAVGCLTLIYAELKGLAEACPDLVPKPNPDHLSRLLAFYAENSFPQANPDELRARFDGRVAKSRDQITQCYRDEDMIEFADAIMGAGSDALFEAALAKPRLPVTNPCF